MSYNISTCRVLKCNAWIDANDVETILELDRQGLIPIPECNFLESVKPFKVAREGKFVIKKFSWSGECSGTSWNSFIADIAPKIKGELEVVLVWEGGDSLTGLRIKDGKVTQPEVIYALAEDK